jgi:hypothetical protein
MLKSPITKCIPWMRDKSTRVGQHERQFSSDDYGSRNIVSHNTRAQADNSSDDEFILHDIAARVRKTTDINITYEGASWESEFGVINGNSEMKRDDKLS